jgi:hypothetical protein
LLLRSGELGTDESKVLERHLSRCTGCSDEWQSMDAVLKSYSDSMTPEIDEPVFDQMVRLATENAQLDPDRQSNSGSGIPAKWAAMSIALGSAAAVALIAIGIIIGRGTTSSPSDFAALRAELGELRGAVLQTGLKSVMAHDRLVAATESARLEQPDDATIAALVDALRTDPSPNVRLAVVDALRQMPGVRSHGPGLIAALGTQDSEVTLNAVIELLAVTQVHAAIPALENLAESGSDQGIRARAQWALGRLL